MWQSTAGVGEHIVEFSQVGGHERMRVNAVPDTPGHIARPAPVRKLPGDAETPLCQAVVRHPPLSNH